MEMMNATRNPTDAWTAKPYKIVLLARDERPAISAGTCDPICGK
jgi:hypothetical protein